MKIIKILWAASMEMHDEQIEFSSLIEHLNHVFEKKDIELELEKWIPRTEEDIDLYRQCIKDCDMCLHLYWKEMPIMSQEALNEAYEETKAHRSPNHLYVFFKETDDELTKKLRDFKTTFVNQYGHFFCKFENVDTMKLHFILQLESLQNLPKETIKIEAKDGSVFVGDESFVNLDNVSFASKNAEYCRLQKELDTIDSMLAEVSVSFSKNTNNKELLSKMYEISKRREGVLQEFNTHQQRLYKMALFFAQSTGGLIAKEAAIARELFENGDAVGADNILRNDEIGQMWNAEINLLDQTEKQAEQHKKNLETLLLLSLQKATTVMANTEKKLSERFAVACENYDRALTTAKKINYDAVKTADVMFDYAQLLSYFGFGEKSIQYYYDAFEIYCTKINDSPIVYISKAAEICNVVSDECRRAHYYESAEHALTAATTLVMNYIQEHQQFPISLFEIYPFTISNHGLLQLDLHNYKEAKEAFETALEIYKNLNEQTSNNYLEKIANEFVNLGNLFNIVGNHDYAKRFFSDALDVYEKQLDAKPFTAEIAYGKTLALMGIGIAESDLNQLDMAENHYNECLGLCISLAKYNTNHYGVLLAQIYSKIGHLKEIQGEQEEALKHYNYALQNYDVLASSNPEIYCDDVALTLKNIGHIQLELGNLEEAKRCNDKALEFYKNLYDNNPNEVYASGLAERWNEKSVVYRKLKMFDVAETSCKNAICIYSELHKTHPEKYKSEYARILNTYVALLCDMEQYEKALSPCKKALGFLESLYKVKPEKYSYDFTGTLFNYGSLYYNLNKYEEAQKIYLKSLYHYRKLAENNHDLYDSFIATTTKNLSVTLMKCGKINEAETVIREAFDNYLNMAKKTGNSIPDIAKSLVELCDILQPSGNNALMEMILLEAISLYTKVSINSQLVLIDLFIRIGYVQKELHKNDEAITSLKKAAEIQISLTEDIFENKKNVAEIWLQVALWQAESHKYEDAEESYQTALDFYIQLAKENEEFKPRVNEIMGNLAFNSLFLQKYELSQYYVTEQLKSSSDNIMSYSNLAPALLFQGKTEEAVHLYIEYKSDLKDVFLADFKEFEKAGVIPTVQSEKVQEIISMLNQ